MIEVIVNSGQYGESEVKPQLSSRVQRYLRLTNPDIPTLTPSWKQQNLKRLFEQDQDTSNNTISADWDNLDMKIREMVHNFSLKVEDLDSIESGALFPVREFDGYRTSKIWGYEKLECNELLRSYLTREHSVSVDPTDTWSKSLRLHVTLGTAAIRYPREALLKIPRSGYLPLV